MSDVVIRVENLGKKYILGHQRRENYTALRDVVANNVRSILHKTKELLKGQLITEGDEEEEFWALKNVSFEIKQGESVGIIGRNGAGKSTLLKILSRITEPSEGRITITGRVASLLEVGTGFHPELSGRENIYLNGAILGMSRAEIKRKFDEIVDFSGVEKFLDTPVKRYSSGMYVRLAFAVAAHLEPEILVVDEVLAVGDAEFQKKCFGKMEDVSKREGKTVLFVSHNMAAVSNLCNNSILLQNGQLVDLGSTRDIIEKYITSGRINNASISGKDLKVVKECSKARFVSLSLHSEKQGLTSNFGLNEDVLIDFEFSIIEDDSIISPSIHLLDAMGSCILGTFNGNSVTINKDELYGKPLKKGLYRSRCIIPRHFLNTQSYGLSAYLVPEDMNDLGIATELLTFSVEETGEMRKEYGGEWIGMIRPKLYWKTEAVK